MSSKKTGIIISIIVVIVSIIAITYSFKEEKPEDNKSAYVITNESLKFQHEYEEYNDEKGKQKISIKSYNTIKHSSYDEIYEIINNKDGEYTIFLGSKESEESRIFAPILVDLALNNNKEIYYLDIYKDLDNKKLNSKGKIEIIDEGSNNYKKLIKKLYDYLPAYKGLNDNSIKRIYLPTLIFISNKKIGLINIYEKFDKDLKLSDNARLDLINQINNKWNKE